ncbi:MAG: hypothetical protein M0R06_01290 [Sphaerochaeta sp.]|jgi:hypothetical protein|nr:hypothetical protein [Sphaerochaeta sp.]
MRKRMFAHRVQLGRIEQSIAFHTFNGDYEKADALREFFRNEPLNDADIANIVAGMRKYEAALDTDPALAWVIGKKMELENAVNPNDYSGYLPDGTH